jgi:hypothetical protein
VFELDQLRGISCLEPVFLVAIFNRFVKCFSMLA